MALSDYEITDSDLAGKKVSHQADTLVGSPAENKQVFDNYADVIRAKHNGMLTELSTDHLTDTEYQDLKNRLGITD